MKFEACQESASRVDNMRAKQSVRREGEFQHSTTIVSASMTVVGVGAAPFVVAQDHRVVWSQPLRGLAE